MTSLTNRTKRRAPVTEDVSTEEDAAINAAIAADPDTLEITRDIATALRPARKPGQRGKQKAPIKELVRVRLDPRVVAHFKAAGEKGWTTRINDFLVDKVVRE